MIVSYLNKKESISDIEHSPRETNKITKLGMFQ